VPADAPAEKLATIRPYGALMLPMVTVDVAVMAELAVIAEREELMLAITTHAHNPEGMRGADAIGAEIACDCSDVTQVYVPTGGGGLATAVARGLSESGSPAALIVCQPSGCAPIARYLASEIDRPWVDKSQTMISGLQLPDPPDGQSAATAVRASGGWGTWVDDESIWRWQQELATTEGVFVEPASALAVAAVAADVVAGRLGENDHPVVILTGSGMKDLRRHATPMDDRSLISADQISGEVSKYLTSRQSTGRSL
jgi:threonine synthase